MAKTKSQKQAELKALSDELRKRNGVVPAFGTYSFSQTNVEDPLDRFGLYVKNCKALRKNNGHLAKYYSKKRTPLENQLLAELGYLRKSRNCAYLPEMPDLSEIQNRAEWMARARQVEETARARQAAATAAARAAAYEEIVARARATAQATRDARPVMVPMNAEEAAIVVRAARNAAETAESDRMAVEFERARNIAMAVDAAEADRAARAAEAESAARAAEADRAARAAEAARARAAWASSAVSVSSF